MVKVFTLNKNGKIEISEEELKQLLDESYWEGYRANKLSWTYTSPMYETPITWNTDHITVSCDNSEKSNV